jgi:hypothetical protein
MEMYYVREYTPTCRFIKIINSTGLLDYLIILRIYSWNVFSITYLKRTIDGCNLFVSELFRHFKVIFA